jgi:hypothetical protein
MSVEDFYFCYSFPLQHFLHDECKFQYILVALHEKTKKRFWLYERNEKLNKAIDKYYSLVKQFS